MSRRSGSDPSVRWFCSRSSCFYQAFGAKEHETSLRFSPYIFMPFFLEEDVTCEAVLLKVNKSGYF